MTASIYQSLATANLDYPFPASPTVLGLTLFEVSNSEDSLLETIYRELIVGSFHDPNDVDSYQGLKHYISSNTGNGRQLIRYHVIAAMLGQLVAGATIFAFFGCRRHCFIKGEYTVVRPALRRNGIAQWLCNARSVIATRDATDCGYEDGVDFSIITSNGADPASSFDLGKNLWSRLGFRTIHFPLVQLPLWEGGGLCEELKLYFKGHSPRFINRASIRSDEMRDIITAVNHFRYTPAKDEQHPKYLAMLELLKARTKFSLL